MPDDVDKLRAFVPAERLENDRLHAIIDDVQHAPFGRCSGRINRQRLRLALEEIEQAEAKRGAAAMPG